MRRVTVTALVAVGAAGVAAMRELTEETKMVIQGKEPVAHVFSHPIAFNLLPEVNVFHADGYSREEWLLAQETRQVLRAPELRIAATAVRVPVYGAHSQNVHAEFSRLINADDARRVLGTAPGIRVQDDPAVSLYPHPLGVAGQDSIAVGRIRDDTSNPVWPDLLERDGSSAQRLCPKCRADRRSARHPRGDLRRGYLTISVRCLRSRAPRVSFTT